MSIHVPVALRRAVLSLTLTEDGAVGDLQTRTDGVVHTGVAGDEMLVRWPELFLAVAHDGPGELTAAETARRVGRWLRLRIALHDLMALPGTPEEAACARPGEGAAACPPRGPPRAPRPLLAPPRGPGRRPRRRPRAPRRRRRRPPRLRGRRSAARGRAHRRGRRGRRGHSAGRAPPVRHGRPGLRARAPRHDLGAPPARRRRRPHPPGEHRAALGARGRPRHAHGGRPGAQPRLARPRPHRPRVRDQRRRDHRARRARLHAARARDQGRGGPHPQRWRPGRAVAVGPVARGARPHPPRRRLA